jgi:hypothetical protein
MATIPVQNALVAVIAGAQSLSAYTDAAGQAVVTLSLTQTQYEALSGVSAVVEKAGYRDGRADLTTLPPFNTAVGSGIDMQVVVEPIKDSSFQISPAVLTFPSTGGTQTIIVAAPTPEWEIVSGVPAGFTYSISGSNVQLTCPAGSDEIQFEMTFKYGTQYRSCAVTRLAAEQTSGAVIFSGKVVDDLTGELIAGAAVELTLHTTINTTTNRTIYLGVVYTDASGNWSLASSILEDDWNQMKAPEDGFYGFVSVNAEANGYSSVLDRRFSGSSLPAFAAAVQSGVAISDLRLSLAVNTKKVRFVGQLRATSPIPGGDVSVMIGQWPNPITSIGSAKTDSGGEYVVEAQISEDEWNSYMANGYMYYEAHASGYSSVVQPIYSGSGMPSYANLPATTKYAILYTDKLNQ